MTSLPSSSGHHHLGLDAAGTGRLRGAGTAKEQSGHPVHTGHSVHRPRSKTGSDEGQDREGGRLPRQAMATWRGGVQGEQRRAAQPRPVRTSRRTPRVLAPIPLVDRPVRRDGRSIDRARFYQAATSGGSAGIAVRVRMSTRSTLSPTCSPRLETIQLPWWNTELPTLTYDGSRQTIAGYSSQGAALILGREPHHVTRVDAAMPQYIWPVVSGR